MKNQYLDLVIQGGHAVLSHPDNPYQLIEECIDIGIADGQIVKIGQLTRAKTKKVFKARGLTILPGIIDTQVHFREPGMEYKEDIESGSRAALLGGVTAFLEMPNTNPPTTSVESFKDKIQRASNRSWCDFGFFIGAKVDNLSILNQLEKQDGCCGVKIFMGKSTGNLLLSDRQHLTQALQNTSGPIAIHSEDQDRLIERKKQILNNIKNPTPHQHPVWRDSQTAWIATKKIVELAHLTKRQVHILHVTTKEEIDFLEQNQTVATVEVTPQHLSLYAPECYDRLGTLAQMNPPIRDKLHQTALWRGVNTGVVTMLGSDHAPHTLEEKNQPYPHSPAGMPGVQTLLTVMLDHVHKKRLSLKKLTELLATNPHRHYGIKGLGLIKEGFKANLTIVDLNKTQTITQEWLASKCKWSPFENQKTTGWSVGVLLKGQWAMREQEILNSPKGELLTFTNNKAIG